MIKRYIMNLKISHNKMQQEIYAAMGKFMKKEQVCIKNKNDNTKFIVLEQNNQIIACVGYLQMRNTVRYKTGFVLPNYRGNGYYKILFNEREKICKCNECTAFCTSRSLQLFLKNNFKIEKYLTNNIVFVRRTK